MLEGVRYAAHAGVWGPYRDRFLPDSGQPNPTLEERIADAASIAGITGLELVYPWHVTPDNVGEVKAALAQHGLVVVGVAASISGEPCFIGGSLTADDPAVRQKAIDRVKTALDLAAELGAGLVALWPGRDGFDYPFQVDYDIVWGRMVDALRDITAHRPDVRIGIEYKLKEPRRHILVSSAAKTLVLIAEVGASNLGVLLDTGHALIAQENLAETVATLSRAGKLFHVHLNDCTRFWDDDMLVGSALFLETLELLYWLDRTGYTGWISFDVHHILDDAKRLTAESLGFVKGLIGVLDRIGREAVEAAISSHRVTGIMALVNAEMFAR